jgi:hypothetical protein
MRQIGLFLILALCGPLFAQITFDPANPPTALTPPTAQYHHWVDNEFTSWDSRNTTHQKGPKTILVILVEPGDGPVWSDPPAFATLDAQVDSASQQYYTYSYHQTWFGPKRLNSRDIPRLVVTPVMRLPRTAAEYRGSFGILQNDCRAATRALGGDWNGGFKDPNNYDRWVVMSNTKMISSTGLAYVGGRFAWLGTNLSSNVALHEWGHNWGVYHANSWSVPTGEPPRSPNGWNSEYQDGWCVMGGFGPMNPMFRIQLKFLEERRNEVAAVTTAGTYRIYNYAHSDRRQPDSLVRALRIPMSPPDPYWDWNREIILGFGYDGGQDGGFGRADYNRNAVTVHAKLSNGSNRLDTTPGSRPGVEDRNDSSIKIGRTYSEPANLNMNPDGFHITPVLRGSDVVNGQTHEWMEVEIHYDSGIPGNEPPTASFPTTLITDALPGVPYPISVTASDPNSDTLAYDWDFGDDTYNIVNSGTQTKTWDTAGVYLVTVTVSDMKGGTDKVEVWVNVGNVPFRAPENPSGTVAGLKYTYYQGTYNQLPAWDNLLPVKQGTVATFSLEPRNRNSGYAFVYEGYLEVPVTDVYTFSLTSRDGSRLYIGDTLVINNDGLKSLATPAAGNIAINAGKHAVRVEMFNRDGNGLLDLSWSTLSQSAATIPASALWQSDPALVTGPTVAITYPESGSNTIVGSAMTLSANADSASGIDRVAFFIGSGYLGEAGSLPYTAEWANLPVGIFFITAVAYDMQGHFTVSEPVLVNVVSPEQRDSIGINFLGTEAATGTLDPADQAGAFYLQANWNNAPMGTFSGDAGHWDATVTGLKDRDGAVTAGWTRYRSRIHLQHSPSGNSMVDTSTPNGRLMRSGLMVRNDTAGPIVEVHDLPYAGYDVYVYFDLHENAGMDATPIEFVLIPGGQGERPAIWGQNSLVAGDGVGDFPNYDTWVGFKEATADSPSAPEDARLGNYLVFRDVSASMFRLESRNSGSGITAVQIVSTRQNDTLPDIYAQPQSVSLPETRTAVFEVKYVGYPQPTVEWFKTGSGTLGVFGDRLTIQNITPADAGDYYAVVTNSMGSDTSNPATLTVTDPPSAAPVGLTAVAGSTSSIDLIWTDPAENELGFVIQRASSESGPWAQIATVGDNVTEFQDGGLPETSTFYYRVASFNDKGESNPSNIAFAETLTSPRDVTFLSQPVTVGTLVGGSASLTVEVDAYPEPEFEWRKDGVVIEGATGSSYTVTHAQLSDHGVYTVRVYNMQSEAVSDPAMMVVTEPLPFGINPLYVINEGSVAENSGTFTMARSGTDVFQGVVSNFLETPLLNSGDYIELSFTLRANTGNNAPRTISYGFFQGPNVTADAQTMVTDMWEGYLHQPGTRNSAGTMNFMHARQGAGATPLMNYATGNESYDGAHNRVKQTGMNQSANTPVTVRLERISETQIRLRSVFTTPDTDRSASGTNSGIVWSHSTVSGVSTVTSTFPAADGPEAFNGFAIATRGNWVLQNLAISTNVTVLPAEVMLADLEQTVDGSPKTPTVSTVPAGLRVSLSYNGSGTAPSVSGIYEVVATVTEPGYTGAATATFTLLTAEGIVDSNGNGAEDAWEQTTFGNLINAPVNIGGRDYTRREVYVWGLGDPLTQVYAMDGMTFPTVSSRLYQLQFRASLTEGDWQDVGEVIVGDGQPRGMVDPQPGFYRVRVRLP